MLTQAPPEPIEHIAASPETAPVVDDPEALIKEARSHARKRRAIWLAAGAAAVLLLAAGVFTAARPSATQNEAAPIADAPAAAVPPAGYGDGVLNISMYVRGRLVGLAEMRTIWLYLYKDGRVITRVFGPGGYNSDTSGDGWYQQRLTPVAAEAVRQEVLAAVGTVSDTPHTEQTWANIEVRTGDGLVYREREPVGTGAYDSFDPAVGILAHLRSRLPASAWVTPEPVPYRPAMYDACGGLYAGANRVADIISADFTALLPDAARGLIADASAPQTPTGRYLTLAESLSWFPMSNGWPVSCRRLSAADTQAVADALDAAGWELTHGPTRDAAVVDGHVQVHDDTGTVSAFIFAGDRTAELEFVQLLPHGIPAPPGLD